MGQHTVTLFTDSQKENQTLRSKTMKNTSNTMKPTLQPYSPEELGEIAEQVQRYRLALRREYTFTDHKGNVHVKEVGLWSSEREKLYQITKDLYQRGARKPKPQERLTLQVIGETIC
jgi:hypothetical protein